MRSRAYWLRVAPILAAVAVVVGVVPTAAAIEYEVFVAVDNDEELLDLYNSETIGEDTFNTLVELLRRGTNLETANREQLYSLPNLTYAEVDAILAYRDEAGRIGDPANLVVADAISRRKLAAIAPFIMGPPKDNAKIGVSGFAKYEVVYAPGDTVAPPMFLQARINTLRHLTVGFAGGLERSRVSNVVYDPARDSLSADGPRARLRLPKYFAQWDTENWGVIAGTYRIGFAQRLVFDTTNRYTPNGFFLDHTVQRRYDLTRVCSESRGELDAACDDTERMAPDYIFRDSQQGVAIGAKKIPLPTGHLQAYGWFSYQPRSLYQYRVRDVSRCPDPKDDDGDCSAPSVFHGGSPQLAPQGAFKNETLPNLYSDVLGGANLSYFYNRRTHVGVTGYGASPVWLVQDADLDFQDWARNPYGGAFGAVGADFSWGRRFADVFGEVARSFDSMNKQSGEGGGGYAALVRNTLTFDNHEIEISGRYYDTNYANPFAGPIAAPDVYDGLRARDEAGGRIRHTAHLFDRLDVRSFLDLWGTLDRKTPKGRIYSRANLQATKRFRPGLWLEYQRRDLRGNDEALCPNDTNATENELVVCRRQRVTTAVNARFDPIRRLYFKLQYRHDFQDGLYELSSGAANVDDGGGQVALEDIDLESVGFDVDLGVDEPLNPDDFRNGFRQDIIASLIVGATPIDKLRLRTRWRWLWDDIADNSRWEHSVWGYFDVSYTIRRWAVPRIRYDIRMFLDGRDSTADRRNPEHWLRFELTSRF